MLSMDLIFLTVELIAGFSYPVQIFPPYARTVWMAKDVVCDPLINANQILIYSCISIDRTNWLTLRTPALVRDIQLVFGIGFGQFRLSRAHIGKRFLRRRRRVYRKQYLLFL